jgi:hypothetical protein
MAESLLGKIMAPTVFEPLSNILYFHRQYNHLAIPPFKITYLFLLNRLPVLKTPATPVIFLNTQISLSKMININYIFSEIPILIHLKWQGCW